MNEWRIDKQWSDRFIPHIKIIIAEFIITEAPIEDDQERNTDLIVLTVKPFRIGCRIRKNKYLEKYGDEFTIRAGRPNGTKTELTKIIEGWGDYFFYGFSDVNENSIERYLLGDLKVFRRWFNHQICSNKGVLPGEKKNNNDNSSSFISFKINDLPIEFIVSKT